MLAGLPSHGAAEVPPANVDLNRIASGWYIVATIPNFLKRGVEAGYDVFTPDPSGEIREDFYLGGEWGGAAAMLVEYSPRRSAASTAPLFSLATS